MASSSNRALIDAVLDALGVAGRFSGRSPARRWAEQPALNVYLEAARRLGVDA